MTLIRIFCMMLFCAAIPCLYAQTLYKQVGKDGKVTYSDLPPAGDGGKSSALEFDKDLNVSQAAHAPKMGKDVLDKGVDARIVQRQLLRDKLRADIEKAQAKLNAARAALATGDKPRDDEWQYTISSPDNAGKPNAQGRITGRGGRVECAADKNPGGSSRINCPSVPVPKENYTGRIKGLEEAVAQAEQELRDAEQAYRRNAPD